MGLLIDTKLRPPGLREEYITRQRLLTQLDRGLEQGLILISAPAGYGKTSLSIDWLRQRPLLTTAWLSLDETDNELDLFLWYLTTAVHNAFSWQQPCANTQTLLNAPHPPPPETIANTLINDLNQLPHPLLLVLDDYHLITLPAIQQTMAALIRHLPAALRLLFVSRMDPPWPQLARWRAQQRIVEIRAADLRFTPEEAQTILTHTVGQPVDETTAVLLGTQTEGWIIGLQLAALSLRGQADPAAFARAFKERGNRLVMDFLLDEVLAEQPPPVLEFLLHTAILERFCAPLCRAVTGQPDFLPYLAQRSLFLVPLDEQGKWYRYHQLFRELLQQRLAQEVSAETIACLHRRAGLWLAGEKLLEEGLPHLLAAGEVATAVSLIEEQRHAALNREDMRLLDHWLGLLPDEEVVKRPSLLQLKAWVLRLQFRFQAIPALLEEAEALAEQGTNPTASPSAAPDILRGERDALRSEIAFYQNNFAASLAFSQSALARLPQSCFFARGIAALYQLSALQNLGQSERALAQLHQWLDHEQLQHHAFKSRLLVASGALYSTAADLANLEQTGRFLLQLGQAENSPLDICWARHFLGHVYYQRNQLDEAYAQWSAVPEWRYHIHFRTYHEAMMGLALVQQARGDAEQAQQTVHELRQALLAMNQNQFTPKVDSFAARLALRRGDLAAARHWVATAVRPSRLATLFLEANELTLIQALLAEETAVARQQAAELLQDCQQFAESTGNTWLLIHAWALRGLLAQAQGDREAALAAAECAVRLAEPSGYLRLFLDLSGMEDLLRWLTGRGVATGYISRILAAASKPQAPGQALSSRELEILALLQRGLSDKAIAGQLFLSVLTVKKHNRNIYQKLRVNGRRQAIALAKSRNLLS